MTAISRCDWINQRAGWTEPMLLCVEYFFAFMAGPLLEFRRQDAGVRLTDTRTKQQVALAAVMVFVAFTVIAAIPFLTR